MRLLLASHSAADNAGAELTLLELARGIVEETDIDIHAVFPSRGPLVDHFTHLGAAVSIIPNSSWTDFSGRRYRYVPRYAASRLRSTYRFVKLINSIRPDVVMTNTKTLVAPALAARLARVPHAWYVHEFGVRDHALVFDIGYQAAMRMIGRLSDLVIVNSEVIKIDMTQWVPSVLLHRLDYGVNVSQELQPTSAPTTPWRLVLVGRKAPGKGQEDAIRAVANLTSRGRDVQLRLVGDGEATYVQSLQGLAAQLGVDDSVEFIGATPDVAAHFYWAHAALVCSRAEAFGRVTVEAMKYERPVIGADSEGTAELIDHGSTGLLYKPGDTNQLADCIIELANNDARARTLARNAKMWADERFSPDRYVSEFLAAILGIKEAGPTRRRITRGVKR